MMQRISLVLALALLGCGNSSPGGGGGAGGTGGGGTGGSGGGGSGSVADLAMPADMTSTSGFCGGQTCGSGTTCCIVAGGNPMCTASCPDGGLSAQCAKPSDCQGATQACCITIANYMPTDVMCKEGAMCMPMINPSTGAGTDRACVVDNDCIDNSGGNGLPDCCTSTQSGQHVCFSKAYLAAVPQLMSYFTCP